MKGVLISIKPKWCELIVQGKKTIEVRKTVPKLRNRVKCYIYCTKEPMQGIMKYLHINNGYGKELGITSTWSNPNDIVVNEGTRNEFNAYTAHGKVIGEFVCDRLYIFNIESLRKHNNLNRFLDVTQLSHKELIDYVLTEQRLFYGLHISELKIYDHPKELSEFETVNVFEPKTKHLVFRKKLKRPPQSWCYVEEV